MHSDCKALAAPSMPRGRLSGGDVWPTACGVLAAAAAAAAAAAIALGVVAAVADAQYMPLPSASCPQGLDGPIYPRGQACYQFNGVEKSWNDARTSCHQGNGRLVAVMDSDLQLWLSSNASALWPNRQGVWLGLNYRAEEGELRWDGYSDSAQPGSYFNWNSGSPGTFTSIQKCVYMRRSFDWRWDNILCGGLNKYSYICEYPLYTNVTTASQPELTTQSVTGLLAETSQNHFNATSVDTTSAPARLVPIVPLAAAAGTLVVIAGLAALMAWLYQRRRRSPALKHGRHDGGSTTMVQNPMYTSGAAFVEAAAAASAEAVHGRPSSNIYVDMNMEVAPISRDWPPEELEDGHLYAEPLQSSAQSASSCCNGAVTKSVEFPPACHSYTYIDAALPRCQRAAAETDAGSQTYEAISPPSAVLSQEALQDGYEPFQSPWKPYENVPKPDLQ